nr:hypothetical protein [Sphingomonas daechungensis]
MFVLDEWFDLAARQKDRSEEGAWNAGFMEHLFDRESATRDVAGVFQKCAIARHQRGCSEAEDLPEREVPRHDRKHDADGIEGYERLAAADVDALIRQIALGVIGEPVAMSGAFLDFRAAVGKGLTHLFGHECGELVPAAAKDFASLADHRRAFGEACLAPSQISPVRSGSGCLRIGELVLMISLSGLAGRGIDGLQRFARLRCSVAFDNRLIRHFQSSWR